MLNIPHRKSYDQGLLNQSTSLSSVQKSLSTIKPNPVFFFFLFLHMAVPDDSSLDLWKYTKR